MSSETQETTRSVDNDNKKLALDSKTGSKNAICLGSYGAFMAVDMLSPSGIREVFSSTPPAEIREIADGVINNIQDCDTHDQEATIKDLSFKHQVLLEIADNNEDKQLTEANEDGNFRSSDFRDSDDSDTEDPLTSGEERYRY